MQIKYIKPNYSQVVLAGLLDALFIIIFFVLLFYFIISVPIIEAYPNTSLIITFILYRLITILLFSSTLGMQVFNLIFLNADERSLSLMEKLLASVFILFRGVDYYQKVRSFV